MSEVQLSGDAPQAVVDEANKAAVVAGSMLREAREAAGLHVAALAVSLKVPVKKLEALEAGRLDLLPDATFARALAATICRGLKLEPKPVLDLLPQNAGSRLGAERPAINTPFHASGSAPGRPWHAKPSPAVLAVLALLLGALAIYFFPVTATDSTTDTSSVELNVAAQASTNSPVNVVVEPSSAVSAGANFAALAQQPASVIAAAGLADTAFVVAFTARGESWVDVTDAKGVAVLRRTLKAGESAEASGVLPLSVVVGRIEAVDVQVRGKPLDLATIAKNNVARFEVK